MSPMPRCGRLSGGAEIVGMILLCLWGVVGISGQESVGLSRVMVRNESGGGVRSEVYRLLASGAEERLGRTDRNGELEFWPAMECKRGDLVQVRPVEKNTYFRSWKQDVAVTIDFVVQRRESVKSR